MGLIPISYPPCPLKPIKVDLRSPYRIRFARGIEVKAYISDPYLNGWKKKDS